MKSKFSFLGHPLHPTLIPLPIGLFSWALLSIVVFVFNDDKLWYDMAFWTAIGGVGTALLAALPGFGDYFTLALKSDARNMATAHMLLNLATVGVFGVGVLLMIDENAIDGGALATVVVLFAVGMGMLGVSGYLGGEMAYRYHLGMVPDDGAQEAEERRRHVTHAP